MAEPERTRHRWKQIPTSRTHKVVCDYCALTPHEAATKALQEGRISGEPMRWCSVQAVEWEEDRERRNS